MLLCCFLKGSNRLAVPTIAVTSCAMNIQQRILSAYPTPAPPPRTAPHSSPPSSAGDRMLVASPTPKTSGKAEEAEVEVHLGRGRGRGKDRGRGSKSSTQV